ncbi:MAG: fibronectin type III domain-containing protein [Desulfuromonadaceae bacterium]
MRLNWKRFTFGTVMLASLVLMLLGCGGGGGNGGPIAADQVSKQITGTVSDVTNNRPLSGAKITAYAIENGAVVSGSALSETVVSGSDGSYMLHIPVTYNGPLMLQAVPPSSFVSRLLKSVFASQSPTAKIRALVTETTLLKAVIPPQNINFASETVAVFIEQNIINPVTPSDGFTNNSGFSSENIRRAVIALETFFGPNFSSVQLPTSATDITTAKQQQDLLVSIKAIESIINQNITTLDVLVVKLVTTGLGSIADDLKRSIATVTVSLKTDGTLPPEYLPSSDIISAISNVQAAPFSYIAENLIDTTPPTVPTNLNVTSVNSRTVSLLWNSSSDTSGGSGVGGYQVYRADASGIFIIIDTVPHVPGATVNYLDALVAPASEYTYKIVAFDVARNFSAATAEFKITTPALPPQADTVSPTTPTGLVSVGTSDTQVNLQWGASTKTNSNGTVSPASGYLVYRDSQIIATVIDNSYIDRAVSPATEYTYYVKSFDAASNNSAASTILTVRTLSTVGTVRPGAPSNLSLAAPAQYNRVLLQWVASATSSVTYNVYRGSDLIASGITSTQYSDVLIIPNSTYNYTVSAVTVTGESNRSNPPLAVTVPASPTTNQTAPSVPQNFTVVNMTGNSVVLTWAESSKPDGNGVVAGYDVLRNGKVIATVATPGYADSSVTPATQYNYEVRSFSTTGTRSSLSSTVTVTTPAAVDLTDTTAPGAPANLIKSAVTSSTVELAWAAPADKDVAGYKIYRDGLYIDFSLVTSYIDRTVTGNSTYTYTVKAYDTAGNISVLSNALPVTTPAPLPETYSLYGRVTLNGVGIPNVILTLSGAGYGNTATDNNGNYSFSNIKNGKYSITASFAYGTVTPLNRSVVVSGANVSGLDFSANLSQSITGNLHYPAGTIIGGITYPNGTVIGGIFYPTSTVIGGVVYPTGTVIGGIKYPNGVVIGGVSYPPGTVVGGVAFPPGTVTTGFTYPTGTIIGGINYPTGVVTGGVITPGGVVISTVTYPTGTVIGGVTYPAGVINGSFIYPTSKVIGGTTYPPGTIIGGITYPNGTVTGGIYYPTSTVIGGVVYPTGTVTGGTTYPIGVVIGGVTYPAGTVVGGVAYPPGAVLTGISYPTGTVIGGITFPNSTVIGGVTYPTSTVVGGVIYPTGEVIGGIKYPNGVVIGGVSYPPGTVVGGVAFPPGTVTAGLTYPTGIVIGGTNYPTGVVNGGVITPGGVAITTVTYPTGTVIGGVTYPTGVINGSFIYSTGSVAGSTTYPTGTIIGGITYPNSTVIGGVTYTTSTVIGGVTYPTGTVIGGISYPSGVVIGGVSYPAGTVVGGVALPPGSVATGTTYPSGTIIGGITYPNSSVIGGVTYSTSTVIGGVVYPTGTVVGGITYPNGAVIGGVSYPPGTVVGGVALPPGSVTTGVVYPTPTIVGDVFFPNGITAVTLDYKGQ